MFFHFFNLLKYVLFCRCLFVVVVLLLFVSSSDLSSQARLLPPKDKVMKYVQLSASDVTKLGFSRENHTHLLVVRPASSKDNVSRTLCVWTLFLG